MKTLTIFTPTYNRAYILSNLYASLKTQTCFDFQWYVINDGSTDNTDELVKGWVKEKNDFNIIYENQKNGGKQNAHNIAVKKCGTELFFCVDSDDYLTEDAVEKIIITWENEKNKENLSGILAMRGTSKNNPLGDSLPIDINYSNLTKISKKRSLGDTALIFRSSVLIHFPFDVVKGEKFIPEEYSYVQIDSEYDMVILPEVIYICNYQPDGYTANTIRNLKNNPKSYIRDKIMVVEKSKDLKSKVKAMAGYIAMCQVIKSKKIIKESRHPFLCVIAYPIGLLNYYLRFKKG